MPPTSQHLADLIALAKSRPIAGIITVPYFDARHASFMHDHTGLPVVVLAHQVGATDDATGYQAMIERNLRALAAGLKVTP